MNEDLQLAKTETREVPARYLLDRPQRLGIIPTWWFWQDKANWRIARVPVLLIMEAAVLAVLLAGLSLPYYVLALIPTLVLMLTLGLLERYIRRRTTKHGALPEPSE